MIVINWNIIWTVVNLIILFILLKIFLFKPVLGMLEKRRQTIENSLNEADQKNTVAGELKAKYEDSLKSARQESIQIVSDAKDRAQVQYNQIIDKANVDATQIVHQANASAVADREAVMKEAQGEIANLALAAASKLLGSNVDAKANKDMLDAFLSEAGSVK
ncbi:MAG: F0F1 ATP synthase subunit B [Oscillospiraceae bacterium]|nr:F0F1 ATP synthase subunit B [Oscillospiraceae bacterium]